MTTYDEYLSMPKAMILFTNMRTIVIVATTVLHNAMERRENLLLEKKIDPESTRVLSVSMQKDREGK